MKLLLIDNYDSFTYNLAAGLAPADVTVCRNDAISRDQVESFDGIVLSPGPGDPANPRDFGVCQEVIVEPVDVPLLGVCLGMQGMAHHTGGRVGPAPQILHGQASPVSLQDHPLFEGVQRPAMVGRYHSLCVEALSPQWRPLGEYQGTLMAMAHRQRPWIGVQFHPESILTPDGPLMLQNFVEMCQ